MSHLMTESDISNFRYRVHYGWRMKMTNKWKKRLNVIQFKERIPCPYCEKTFPSNVSLCRHVLRSHNWNKDFLKGFEVVETHGAVMIVKRIEEK